MKTGFVYVLFNPSLPGLVKIGRTSRKVLIRATELSSTGLPDSFVPVWEELVTDAKAVESLIHNRLGAYRYRANREFFVVPVKEAIQALMKAAERYRLPDIGQQNGAEILPELKAMRHLHLKPDLASVRIIHIQEVVYLESLRRQMGVNRQDDLVTRTDLDFIYTDPPDIAQMFTTVQSEQDNARILLKELATKGISESILALFTDLIAPHVTRQALGNDPKPVRKNKVHAKKHR